MAEPRKRATKRFGYANETQYPTREVAKIVRWVMKYLEVEQHRCFVKIKHHNNGGAYQGRFYPNGRVHGGYIYDWERGDWKDVSPNVPAGYNHLIVCRIAKPGSYPRETHVYDRKDSPGTWICENWQEALVSIMAHEGMHLRQYFNNPRGKRGRFNEVETEWAAYRLWNEYRATH